MAPGSEVAGRDGVPDFKEVAPVPASQFEARLIDGVKAIRLPSIT